ncbi:MAG: hypothetical protein Q8P86_03455 [bacterium]|nr:hypothetical protein [bacterium]
MELREIAKNIKDLHHCYCLEGKRDFVLNSLFDFFEKDLNLKRQGNPDFWIGEFDILGIDDVRTVIEAQRQKPVMEECRMFVIAAYEITKEAQNALLKVLEEPSSFTKFFIIVDSAQGLLPTVRSRAYILSFLPQDGIYENGFRDKARDFLSFIPAKRIKFVKKLSEDISDGKEAKIQATRFLNALELCVRNSKDLSEKEKFEVLRHVAFAEKYSQDRGAVLKQILEHVAVSLPVF